MILSNCKLDDLKDHRHFPSKWLPENIILSNTKFIFSTFPNIKTFGYPKCPGYHGSDLVVNLADKIHLSVMHCFNSTVVHTIFTTRSAFPMLVRTFCLPSSIIIYCFKCQCDADHVVKLSNNSRWGLLNVSWVQSVAIINNIIRHSQILVWHWRALVEYKCMPSQLFRKVLFCSVQGLDHLYILEAVVINIQYMTV